MSEISEAIRKKSILDNAYAALDDGRGKAYHVGLGGNLFSKGLFSGNFDIGMTNNTVRKPMAGQGQLLDKNGQPISETSFAGGAGSVGLKYGNKDLSVEAGVNGNIGANEKKLRLSEYIRANSQLSDDVYGNVQVRFVPGQKTQYSAGLRYSPKKQRGLGLSVIKKPTTSFEIGADTDGGKNNNVRANFVYRF